MASFEAVPPKSHQIQKYDSQIVQLFEAQSTLCRPQWMQCQVESWE